MVAKSQEAFSSLKKGLEITVNNSWGHSNYQIYILLTSSNNQISEFRIPNIYNEILFILFSAWLKLGPTVSSAIYNPL